MTREETITKAMELLKPYTLRYEKTLKELWWVDNGYFTSEDCCEDCIDEALNDERRDYLLKQRLLPIDWRDEEFYKFEKKCSVDYESEYFLYCTNCKAPLYTNMLQCSYEMEHVIETFKAVISDDTCYQAYVTLENDWNNLEKYPKEYHLTLELAELVIEKLK